MAFAGRTWVPDGRPFAATAPNLTPDPETGIGRWDRLLARRGRFARGSRDGRALFRSCRTRFRSMSDEDVASVIVYLRSLKPIRNALAKSHLPFPLNRSIATCHVHRWAIVPDLSTPEKRGEYIATVAACADCHTPMDAHGTPLTQWPSPVATRCCMATGKVRPPRISPRPSTASRTATRLCSSKRSEPQGALAQIERHDADAVPTAR